MNLPPLRTIAGLRLALDAGRVSAGELLSDTLLKSEGHSAVATLRPDVRISAEGPLAGIPLAHKDMFERPGEPMGMGAHPSAAVTGRVLADVLSRLDAAGQSQVATLRMSEFAMGPTGQSAHHPLALNPVVEGAIPGGSSSGSGVAVASGLVPAALGSDTGGSIRIPAACNAVVGFKPGAGVVPMGGAMPLSWTQDCVGPLAASVACARTILGLISGRRLGAEPRSLRLGLWSDGASERMRAALADVARLTEGDGHGIADVDLANLDILAEPANVIAISEAATVHADRLATHADAYGPQVRSRLVQAGAIPAAAYLRALQIRRSAQDWIAGVFTDIDAILMPTLADIPPQADALDTGGGGDVAALIGGLTGFTRPASVLGLPALSLPAAMTPDGPLSVQIVGPSGGEATIATLAERIEAALALRPSAGTP